MARHTLALALAMALVLLAACGGRTDRDDDSARPPAGTGSEAPPTTLRDHDDQHPDDPRMIELEERFDRWELSRPASYRFTVTAQCFCLAKPRTITVEDGQVVAEQPAADASPATAQILTVDDLFDRARQAIDDADRFEVVYHDEFDFPAVIDVDLLAEAIDDEITYLVTDFQPLPA
jgi:hypothetical protein